MFLRFDAVEQCDGPWGPVLHVYTRLQDHLLSNAVLQPAQRTTISTSDLIGRCNTISHRQHENLTLTLEKCYMSLHPLSFKTVKASFRRWMMIGIAPAFQSTHTTSGQASQGKGRSRKGQSLGRLQSEFGFESRHNRYRRTICQLRTAVQRRMPCRNRSGGRLRKSPLDLAELYSRSF